jgi:glycosyltransferase involved in cell wall biosynthesis
MSLHDRRACAPAVGNVLYVGTLPPHPGGSAISGSQHILTLARQGHRVRALAPITAEAIPAEEEFAARHPEINITRFLLPFFETSSYTPAPEEQRRYERAQLEPHLDALIGRERPDLVFIGRETFVWYVPDIAERHGLPCLLRIAGGLTQGVLDRVYPEPLARRVLEQFHRINLIVAQTPYVTGQLRQIGCANVRTIPNAVDTDQFHPNGKNAELLQALGITDNDIVVLHASNMKAVKRPLDIVASAERALRRHPELVYTIVGDGQYLQAMKDACRERRLGERFRFVGWVPYERMPDYLSVADIVVMPSETEMQARMYLETQASGRVLVASDIPAAREVVVDGESGLLFRKGDADDLAAKTVLAAGDPQLRREIGHKGRERVMAHALEHATAAWAEAIGNVVRKHRGPA